MISFLLILPSLVAAQSASKSCFVCASEGLRSRWYLTGLPSSSISDSQFTSSCESTPTSSIDTESCAGPCFTYIFDDPDSPSLTTPTTFFVRGCHDQMVGIVSDRLTSGGAQNGLYCEYDSSYTRPDSRGVIVTTRALIEYCGSDDGCNKRTKFPTASSDACNGQTYNSTVNNEPLNCYDCSDDNHNCNKNRCYKKYCSKSKVKMTGGGYSIRKTCSNVNILGVDNACSKNDIITVPDGNVAVPMESTQCFCKDKQYCNSAPERFLASLLPLLLLPFLRS